MRAQFHHGNWASWGWFGALLVAVERPMSVFEVVTMDVQLISPIRS